MRIAFVAQPFDQVLPPNPNSIGLIIHNTARRLARKHDVAIYMAGKAGERVASDDGIEYRRVSVRLDNKYLGLCSKISGRGDSNGLVSSPLYYAAYGLQVALDLRRRASTDWVHILDFSNYPSMVRRFNPRSRIALEMQCEWLTQFDHARVKRRLRHVDLITGSSGYIANKIATRFPERANDCVTSYNGFDAERFQPRVRSEKRGGRPTRILFVGRTSPEKGVHTLLEAMKRVLERRSDARLDVVGGNATLPRSYIVGVSDDPRVQALSAYYDGTVCDDYQAYLRSLVQVPPLAGRVNLVGHVAQAELPEWYRRADVLVNPSFSESFGMSLVEAMASEVPVVATRVGGMPEIVVPGETGHLVEPGDVRAIAEAILQCIDSWERRDKIGRAGRERALRVFSWEARVAALEEAYALRAS